MSDIATAKQQFLRALDIIEQTQLTVFVQQELPSRSKIEQQLEQVLLLSTMPDIVSGMRDLLNEILSRYNDPFANYINPVQHARYQQRRTGGFVGLGLKFRAINNAYPLVIGPLLGGPLENRDIKPGDQILSANDKDLKGMRSREVTSLFLGKPESSVKLVLKRGADQKIQFTSNRQAVKLHYTRSALLSSSIGYIKISRFGGTTHDRVRPLLESLLTQKITGLVLDLRDNPGGSTRAARNIMSLFDVAPWVYCERYKSGKVKRLPRAGSTLTDIPMVVLVNERSMSSAEIVAGALQDYKRAWLVGAPTYGKGLIQKVFPLKLPLGGAVRTTIAQYGTPSHRLLHGRGLLPDVYVPSAPDGLFRETGSVNINQQARDFRRKLLLEELSKTRTAVQSRALAQLPDAQLDVAVSMLS